MDFFITLLLAVFCVGIKGECDKYGAIECEGYNLLPDHPLGLPVLDEIEPLCRVVTTLTNCLNASIGGCKQREQITWRSAILSAKYICKNQKAYRESVSCFLKDETVSAMEKCAVDLSDNIDDIGCGSFPVFKNCTIKAITTNCQPEAVVTMRAILDVNTVPKLDAMKCPVEDTTTQKQTTSSTTQKQPTSSTRPTTMAMRSSTEESVDVKQYDNEAETDTKTGNIGQSNNANYHVINFYLLVIIPQIILLCVL